MIEVVPAILEKNINEIKRKIELVKPYAQHIHLDVMDGEFVPNTTFNKPEELSKIKFGIKINPHLMIKRPEFFVKQWAWPEVETIIAHKEAVTNMEEIIKLIKGLGKRVGVALNPRTASYDIQCYLKDIDLVLVMGVEPGLAGQAFNEDVLAKIKQLREWKPELDIEVDGGISNRISGMVIKAGANMLAANSYIFSQADIKEAIDSLKQ
jgi:ribulose-phosphate 3-epimerase